jgi:hypothetical protein
MTTDDDLELSPENMLKWSKEPLHPDLEPWVGDTKFGPSLRHPLVYHCPLILPGMANRSYLEDSGPGEDGP